jgi:hypothetical protein
VSSLFADPYAGQAASQVCADAPTAAEVADSSLWQGIAGMRAMAAELRMRSARFSRAPVGALIQQALRLTKQLGPRSFRLITLWHRTPDTAGRELARELDRLRARMGGEIDWISLTTAQLVARLDAENALEAGHARALCERYLPA